MKRAGCDFRAKQQWRNATSRCLVVNLLGLPVMEVSNLRLGANIVLNGESTGPNAASLAQTVASAGVVIAGGAVIVGVLSVAVAVIVGLVAVTVGLVVTAAGKPLILRN
jgi:hypothetical protein